MNPPYIYGFYTPKIEALTGTGDVRDLMTSGGMPNESSASARASAVRFFCNGEFAGFMVLKPVFGGQLRNPFEPRFTRVVRQRPEEVPFWDKQVVATTPAATAEFNKRRQIEEFLGNYFFDEEGSRLTEIISVADLEKAFLELSPEQKHAIVERKMVDELHTSGTRAFVARDYEGALKSWTRILGIEQDNPRASILLLTAIRDFAKVRYNGDEERARKENKVVTEAFAAIARQQTLLALNQVSEEQQEARERAIVNYRTRALNYLSEGNFAESLKEWDKLLGIDPGNASALTFRDICERKIRAADGRR
jgi:tetratricopeptide (TPR) repeat protein